MLQLLFFCSGASGLIYQVVWVREFGYIFGNTIYSAALVIAMFMCGLGVGSYLGGRWADRRPSPLVPPLDLYTETVGRRYREASFFEYRLPVCVCR